MTDPRVEELVALLDERLNATDTYGVVRIIEVAEAIVARGHFNPATVDVDAVARSLAGLSERLWHQAVADGDASVSYYREQAIHAIAAAVADQPAHARQATNDQLDEFTAGLITTVALSPDVDKVARAIAAAADADYWVGEIAEWEALEDWEREAHPENEPSMAFEDREWFRRQARVAIAAQGLTS